MKWCKKETHMPLLRGFRARIIPHRQGCLRDFLGPDTSVWSWLSPGSSLFYFPALLQPPGAQPPSCVRAEELQLRDWILQQRPSPDLANSPLARGQVRRLPLPTTSQDWWLGLLCPELTMEYKVSQRYYLCKLAKKLKKKKNRTNKTKPQRRAILKSNITPPPRRPQHCL